MTRRMPEGFNRCLGSLNPLSKIEKERIIANAGHNRAVDLAILMGRTTKIICQYARSQGIVTLGHLRHRYPAGRKSTGRKPAAPRKPVRGVSVARMVELSERIG